MKRIGFLSFAVAATLTAGCSGTKDQARGQVKNTDPVTAGTRGAAVDDGRVVAVDIATQDAKDFIRHLATVNMAEIDLAKLAADRGTAADVKKFAQMMIDDHSASRDKLDALASDLKIDPPGELDDKHRDQRDKLAKQTGADFDREYASAMVDGHKDLVDQLEPRIEKKALEQWKVEMNGRTTAPGATVPIRPDPSDNQTTMRINQFAADIYPTAHAHLEAARALESSLKKRHTTP